MRTWSHARKVVVYWLVASAIATPLVVVFLGPLLPPGHASSEASGQVTDNTVMTAIVTPVVMLILVYFAYVLIVFRQQGTGIQEGTRSRGNMRVQTTWVVATSVLVLFLFGYGTWRLLEGGTGGGQGPSPIAVPAGNKLQVQAIAQQWAFTYRYPSYGGLETPHLVLPVGQLVELHVTSLDAIHSFWAYNLGVKADANPGVDNVAYVTPTKLGSFAIHCAELCGLFHGYMFDTGRVVSQADFAGWVHEQQATFQAIARYLPPYALTYLPKPDRRAG